MPYFDQGFSALVDDLHAHGMADDVAVVARGEFGRPPPASTKTPAATTGPESAAAYSPEEAFAPAR